MGMMVYTGTSDLTFDGAYGRETYTAYNGRSTPRCFVDESCEVVQAHPLLFRRAHASEGARSRGERDCIRSNIGGLTIPFDVIRLRDVDPALYEELRQAVLRLKEENPPTAEDKTNTGPHLADGALHNLVHAHRHGERLEAVKNDPAAVSFNAEHCTHQLGPRARNGRASVHPLDRVRPIGDRRRERSGRVGATVEHVDDR
jgi:hypothetical protein